MSRKTLQDLLDELESTDPDAGKAEAELDANTRQLKSEVQVAILQSSLGYALQALGVVIGGLDAQDKRIVALEAEVERLRERVTQ